MQQYGNQGQGGFQRPGSTASFAGQPAPPPAYGAPQGFQSPTSPSVNQSQWAPPTQSPPPMQQQWNQPPAQQAWGQNPQAQQQQQQQAAGAYNPGTYGAMPGGYTQSAQGAIPSQNQSQGNVGNAPPPPPPKPGQFEGGMQSQPQQSWNQQQTYTSQQPAQNFQAQAQNTGFTQQNQPGQFNQQAQGYPGQPPQQAVVPSQPVQNFQAQPQNAGFTQQNQPGQFNQQGQQGGYSGQPPQQGAIQGQPPQPQAYNTAAPPPPSATPGGSYFPPSNRPTSIYGSDPSSAYPTPQSAVAQTPPSTVISPDAQHPVYIPPSLSGQGVQAYMPANTNPLPGVYVPPPPDIPAWTQAQHPPGQGGAKKFRYTKPNPQPQFQPGPPQGFQGQQAGFQPMQQPVQQFQPQQPMPMQNQMQPMQNQFQQAPQQQGFDQQQQFSNQVQPPVQQPQYGQQMMQAPPQPQPQQFGQPIPQQQGQFPPQQFQQPPVPAPYGSTSQPAPQQDWQAQGQQPGQAFQGGQNQTIQAPKPVHGQIQAQATQHLFNAHIESSPPVSHSQPVSPIHQKRNSVFGSGQGGGTLGRTDSISSIAMGRGPASSSKTTTPVQRGPSPPAPAIAATALGMGGPSDWEHFGCPDDEIDDEEFFSAKGKEDSHHVDSVELPTAPSPQLAPTASAVSVEEWPTPPAPAPLNVNRPSSGFQHGGQSGHQQHYNPTPPPKAPDIPLPHGPDMHEAPAQRSPDTARASQQWPAAHEHQVQPHAETAPAQGFVMNDGGWVPPVEQSKPQHEPSVKKPASPPPASNFVMDDGGWGNAQPSKTQEPASINKEPESSFVMDDGGWSAAQSVAAAKPQEPQRKTQSPSPQPGGFVMNDGGWGAAQTIAPTKAPEPQHEEPQKKTEPPTARDLIPDIDPWYAGSLERYIGMLRQEAAAVAVEDKKKVFTDFLASESEIRSIDYYRAPPVPLECLKAHVEDQPPKVLERKMTVTIPAESYVMEHAPEEYSPGGRPILRRKPTLQSQPSNVSTEKSFMMAAGPEERTPIKEFQHGPPSPIKDHMPKRADSRGYRPYSIVGAGSEPSNQSTTILTPTSSTGDEFSKAMQTPEQPIEPPQPQQPVLQQPPQPQYKPYSPGENIVTSATTAIQDTRDRSDHRQSLSFAVAPLQVSRKGDEIFFNEPHQPELPSKPEYSPEISPSHTTSFSDHAMDLPAPLNLSSAKPTPTASTPTPAPVPPPASSSSSALAALIPLLPKSISQPSSHPALTNLQALLSAHPADFTFLTSLTTTYETAAAALRSTLDRERRARQEENEARTDQLFNDNEISYADIGSLEDEYKAEEKRRKAKEDREEYARFVEGVFDKAYEQLQENIRALMGGLAECEKLLDTSIAGVQALEGSTAGSPPPTLLVIETLVKFHEAVELRHERITLLVAERDKRYKKTEIQPLYADGNFAKMKTVERHFENAERQAVLRAKGERADRTAELVRGVEEAVVRAVGANQEARDEIVAVLARVSPQEVQAENGAGVIEMVDQTLKALAQSSKELMTKFNEVELVLNGAVLEAEIAHAKAENMAVGALEAELKEGEERLRGELTRRLGVLEEDLREGEALVKERLAGVEARAPGGRAGSVSGSGAPLGGEEEKAARLKAALEEAKRRNGH